MVGPIWQLDGRKYLYQQMFYLLCSDENLAILVEWGLKVSLSNSDGSISRSLAFYWPLQ